MVLRKRLGEIIVALTLLGCGTEQAPVATPPAKAPAAPAVALSPALQARRAATVRRFLQWYQGTQPRLDALLTATVRKPGQGDTAHYQVDEARATEYLRYLEQAGWFSTGFIRDQQQQFRRRGQDFRRTRQAYGPPVGFEFGWILYTPQPARIVAAALKAGRIEVLPGEPQWQARVRLPGTGSLMLELVDTGDSTRITTIYPDGIEQDLGR